MKTIRKVLAAVVCMAMLFGSVSAFAAEAEVKGAPARATSPTWGDIWELDDYVDSFLDWESDTCVGIPDADIDYAIKFFDAGTTIVSDEKSAVRGDLGEAYYWGKAPKDVDDNTPLTGDAKDNYSAYYDACIALLNSITTATGYPTDPSTGAPVKATNPRWGDVQKLNEWINSSITFEDCEWIADADMEDTIWRRPKDQKIASLDKEEERSRLGEAYYWEKEPEGSDVWTLLEDDAKDNYDAFYAATVAVYNSMTTGTGEWDDLSASLSALEDACQEIWTKVGNEEIYIISDDDEAPEDESREWIYESAYYAFDTAVNDIYANEYPGGEFSDWTWDNLTKVQFQNLIDLFKAALDAAKAGGDFTVETPDETPDTPSDTPETPAETPGTSSNGTETPKASDNSATVATGTATVAAAVAAIPTTSSVNGVKSTVSGAFAVTKVNGVAFITPLADIVAGYGIASGERAYAKVWDLDPKKSNLAYAVIENAAAALGAEVGPGLQLELGKMSSGKYSLLSQDGSTVKISVGVPASFVEQGKTLAVVRVRPGGAVSILPDLDADPATVTFETTGGAGAYAIVKY